MVEVISQWAMFREPLALTHFAPPLPGGGALPNRGKLEINSLLLKLVPVGAMLAGEPSHTIIPYFTKPRMNLLFIGANS